MNNKEWLAAAGLALEHEELLAQLLIEEGVEFIAQPRIAKRESFGVLPLALAQQRLWFLDQIGTPGAVYTIPFAIRLAGRLEVAGLTSALDAIMQRHEVLRATFVLDESRDTGDAQPIQRIGPAAALPLPIIDLRALRRTERDALALRLAVDMAAQPFDLGCGPLIRALLLRLNDAEHLLVLVMHHIIADGWSRNIFMREVKALYSAYVGGTPALLPDLAIQYGDFVIWQREWLHGPARDAQLAYWLHSLADAPVLRLPTDRPRPMFQTHAGATHAVVLPTPLAEALKDLSRRAGSTLFMTLLAGFNVLLYRYSGQDDLAVGTPVANRQHLETEALIGLFINMLVLRTNLGNNPSFRVVMERIQAVCLAAFANQDLPFEQVVEALGLPRDVSRSPLFQVLFDFQHIPLMELNLPGLAVSSIDIDNGTTKFDLEANLWEGPAGLHCVFRYNTALFDTATIEQLARHYQVVLVDLAANPDRKIGALPLLSPAEQRQIVEEWNATQRAIPAHDCLHTLFALQAAHTPDAIALAYADQQLTYRELNARANQLARVLQAHGVRPEVLVGICIERSIELVIGLLGVLKAGGAYVPLDPSYPAERLAFMLEDSQAALLLTHQSIYDLRLTIDDLGASDRPIVNRKSKIVNLAADWPLIAQAPDQALADGARPDNLAYVIYTSGSTGRPKGVQVAHRGIVNRLLWMQDAYQLTAADHVLQKTPISFDVSVWEFFWPLSVGARLVIARPDGHRDSSYLVDLIVEQAITIIHFVPSMLQVFLEEPGVRACRSLRQVVCSGEALTSELQQCFFERMAAQLANLYGPTEASVDVTAWACDRNAPSSPVPIGRPIANVQVYILDAHFQPVAIGVVGELYLGGVQLARGYLARPDLTAERFVPNPWGSGVRVQGSGETDRTPEPRPLNPEPSARLYKTGDLARYRRDGAIEYIDRIDDQVKIQGARIELREVEACLLRCPHIREAAVLVREDTPGDRYLAAYLVVDQGVELLAADVRRFMLAHLPAYMVPAVFVVLPALPLTPSGKLDRRALPAPNRTRPDAAKTAAAPRTWIEEVLTNTWAQIFAIDVGIHDSFFELGGDSIRGIRVVSKARARGLRLSLQQVFQYQTIAELARVVSPAGYSAPAPHATAPFGLITERDRAQLPPNVVDAYPLTQLQAGMIFHREYQPDSDLYHNVDSIYVRTQLNLTLLWAAVRRLVARHPVLRTCFDLSRFSEPLQLVYRTVDLPFQIIDLRALPATKHAQIVADWIENEKKHYFDMTCSPLIRFQIHLHAENMFQFSIPHHHAILDGWSISALCAELLYDYFYLLRGTSPPITLQPISTYRDFVALERMALASEECRRYWAQKLDAFSFTPLPRWKSVERRDTSQYAELAIAIAPERLEDLRYLARSIAVPLKTVLLAAHLRVICLLSGQPNVLTGLASNGRPEDEWGDRVLGLFLNSIPIGLTLGGTWRDLVQETFKAEQELLPFRRYPMAELQKLRHGQPLFETLFNFTNFHILRSLEEIEGLEIIDVYSFTRQNFALVAHFNLDLSVLPRLTLTLSYDAAELSSAQVAAIGHYYSQTLAAMVHAPDTHYELHSLLSAAERQQILEEWNATHTAYPRDASIDARFADQAAQTPDAVALVFEEQQITYCELHLRANRLAHYLQSLSVGPEICIGVCLERSLDLVIGLLGILKAGAAYVPLDPTYPRERLHFMLNDAKVAVLLTERRLRDRLPSGIARIVCLDSAWPDIARHPTSTPVSDRTADYLAYVMYTSGSTGHPKGVGIVHRSVLRLVQATTYTDLTADQIFLQLAPIAFDAATFEIWGSLLNGARLVIGPAHMLSVAELGQVLERFQITTLWLTAGLFQQMIDGQLERLRYVRQLLTGGDVVSAAHARKALRALNRCVLINGYGPTENTTFTTCYPMTDVAQIGAAVAIGRPIANSQVYILNPQLQPVPIAVPGELYAGGDGLARAYLNRPDTTAERFVPNPFTDFGFWILDFGLGLIQNPKSKIQNGTRLYKTGDIARYLPDGTIEFLGRSDDQLKLRGFRIELGEIETVLGRHPGVRACVVVARERAPGEKELVAYVVQGSGIGNQGSEVETTRRAVSTPDPRPLIPDLRAFLAERLPAYMLPTRFVALPALPLTANGKVDRQRLPEPDQRRFESSAPAVAPRTLVEEVLATIWLEVLGIEQVGVYDSFFALGGHSLLATQAVARIRDCFNVDFPLRSFFEAPSIADVAARLLQQAGDGSLYSQQIPRRCQANDIPLSFAQQRLWFIDQLEPESAAYIIPAAIRLRGRLDLRALSASINEVVRRHEVLRTIFITSDGRPSQRILAALPLPCPLIDLRDIPTPARHDLARRLTRAAAHRSFDLACGPLLRAALLQLDDLDQIVLLTMHHIVADGWSISLFIRELVSCYRAFVAGHTARLHNLPIQYADYAIWQQERLRDTLEPQLAYRCGQLADLPVLDLPADHPRPAVATANGASRRFTLAPELSIQLRTLGQPAACTIFMTLLTAFQVLLARYSGQNDIAVGTVIAGRMHSQTEQLIGCFVNTLVVRSDLSGDPPFQAALQRVRTSCLDAYAHQDVPFERLVDALQPVRDLSRHPLFQVMFALQNTPTHVTELPDLTVNILEMDSAVAKFDLDLSFVETPEGLAGSLVYNTDLFEHTTMIRLLGHFQVLLDGIIANPTQRLADLPLLSKLERQQLLVEWNATAAIQPSNFAIHECVAEQAARRPDAVALVFEGEHLTYRALNQQSNQTARSLRRLGARPEVRVGLCVERSLDMVVGLLGVIKAGAAYVPLDPSYPREWLALVLEDIQAPVLLTQRSIRERIPTHSAQVLYLDSARDVSSQACSDNIASHILPDNLAYVIYTSGSTGKPKGVQITNGAVANHLQAMQRRLALQEHDVMFAVTTLAFDIAVLELFLPLTVGTRMILAPQSIMADGPELLARLTACAATVVQATPATWRILLESGWQGSERLHMLCGGEALPPTLAGRLLGLGASLWNLYGPTETTVWSAMHEVLSEGRVIPIGRPIANTQIYLLDTQLRPVPIGVPGELFIGGAGLARGYLNDPGLTAERFVPNPFAGAKQPSSQAAKQPGDAAEPQSAICNLQSAIGTRLYRTGDLARYQPDGRIEFLGRRDHQVKLRGFRIELDAIAAVLSQHPALREAVVLARADRSGEQYLVAYIVPSTDDRPPTIDHRGHPGPSSIVHRPSSIVGELRSFLAERLPDYMLPMAFVVLDAFPLTPNHKLDRRALLALSDAADVEGNRSQAVLVAPRDRWEWQLAQIWQELLPIRPIGVTQTFFELGGHSLLAVRLIAHIQRQFGRRLPLATLFQETTIERLADVLRRQPDPRTWSPLVPIQPAGTRAPLFFAHPIGGNVFCYADLARHLGPDQPLYGLQAPGVDGEQAPYKRLEELAACYIAAIKQVQPEGPYILGGWSMGGVVALEMAQQLQAQAQRVAQLIVIDSSLLHGAPVAPEDDADILAQFAYDLAGLFGKRLDIDTLRQLEADERLQYVLSWVQTCNVMPPTTALVHLRDLIAVFNAHLHAVQKYTPRTYPQRIFLLQASDSGTLPDDRDDWSRIAPAGVVRVPVPGDHYTILRPPHVQVLAERLREIIH